MTSAEATAAELTPIRRRYPWSRLSVGHLLMIVAFVLAALANLVVLRRADVSFPVAVAATDLVPGRLVAAEHLRLVELDAGPDVLATLIGDVAAVEGRLVVRPVRAGELVRAADFRLVSAPGGLRAMSIPVDPEHAVGGGIAPGDRVDVIGVVDEESVYVVTAAEVLEVSSPSGSALPAASTFYLVVAVDAETALRLAAALRQGDVEVVRSTGAPAPGQGEQ